MNFSGKIGEGRNKTDVVQYTWKLYTYKDTRYKDMQELIKDLSFQSS